LTTEYFATVVFRPHTRSVYLLALTQVDYGLQTTDFGEVLLPAAWSLEPEVNRRQFRVLMVKLLRAHGGCLGARRR
jgi:hypothetical protein